MKSSQWRLRVMKYILNRGPGTVYVQKMNVFPLIILYPEAAGWCPTISAEISKPC